MNSIAKGQNKIAAVIAVLLNAILFFINISFYNCVFATNDDYRMNLIVSGAYTGEPSANLVFMRYPIAWLLSGLYNITDNIPWYGIGTMLCIFVPSCIICYFVIREADKKGRLLMGILAYLLFYLFIVQKHIVLPQFTATAAFMSVAWLALIWYMPSKRSFFHIIAAAFIAVVAFCIRMKIFFMVLPAGILVIAAKTMFSDTKDRKYMKMCMISCLTAVVLCGLSYASDRVNYQPEYKEFNTARSQTYDYGALPPYDMNKDFYDAAEIDESTYYSISARHLDMDDQITTNNLQDIVGFIAQKDGRPFIKKCLESAFGSILHFFDGAVVYQAIFVFAIMLLSFIEAYKKKKRDYALIIAVLFAGMLLEMTYLVFRSRVMERFTEVFLLVIAVVSLISYISMLDKKPEVFKGGVFRYKNLYRAAAAVCAVCVIVCIAVANQRAVTSKSKHQNLVNSRLETLNALAQTDRSSFYFYDAYDFIGASADVFSVYDGMVNTDSLGNWYINSEDYFERNGMYGFENSIDGLIDGSKNIYFAAIGNLKNGVKLLLKERYNMEAVIIDTIPYENNNIYIYTFVPCG